MTQRDLDKIFALYLESIGGTTQLVKMTPRFSARSFHVRRLTQQLNESDTEIVAQIKASFRPGRCCWLTIGWNMPEIPRRGDSARLCADTPGAGRSMAAGSQPHACQLYPLSKLSATSISALLDEYAGGDTLDAALQAALAEDLNHLLPATRRSIAKTPANLNSCRLSKGVVTLRGIYGDFLRQRYADETDEVKKAGLAGVSGRSPTPARPRRVMIWCA